LAGGRMVLAGREAAVVPAADGGTAAGAACKSSAFGGAGGPWPCGAMIAAPAIALSCILDAVSFAPERSPEFESC